MDTNEHASSNQAVEPSQMWRRLELTGIRSLKTPGPGAVAHMSLHQKTTMSKNQPNKEADNSQPPCFHRGSGCPLNVGDQLSWTVKPSAPRR